MQTKLLPAQLVSEKQVLAQGHSVEGLLIVVELDDGSKHHLSYLAEQVKHLWRSYLT